MLVKLCGDRLACTSYQACLPSTPPLRDGLATALCQRQLLMGVRVEAVAIAIALLHINHHANVVVQWRNYHLNEVGTAFRG